MVTTSIFIKIIISPEATPHGDAATGSRRSRLSNYRKHRNSFEISKSISRPNANVTFYGVRTNVLVPNSFARERYTRVALQ